MGLSLAALSIGSVFIGFIARDLFLGLASEFWGGVLTLDSSALMGQLRGEFIPMHVKFLPLVGTGIATFVVYCAYGTNLGGYLYGHLICTRFIRTFIRFFSHKWYFDLLYNVYVNRPLLS